MPNYNPALPPTRTLTCSVSAELRHFPHPHGATVFLERKDSNKTQYNTDEKTQLSGGSALGASQFISWVSFSLLSTLRKSGGG